MKRTTIVLGIASVIGASPLGAEESRTSIAPDRISLFTVPLRCGAAPEIGCGPISKPILLQLEGEPAVTQAWLNGNGTVLAVVWGGERWSADTNEGCSGGFRKERTNSYGIGWQSSRRRIEEFSFGRPLVPRRGGGQLKQTTSSDHCC